MINTATFIIVSIKQAIDNILDEMLVCIIIKSIITLTIGTIIKPKEGDSCFCRLSNNLLKSIIPNMYIVLLTMVRPKDCAGVSVEGSLGIMLMKGITTYSLATLKTTNTLL